MDTQNFQVSGESPNPSNDFQAGEFAQSPDVSPVATRPAALGNNQLSIDDSLLSKAVTSFQELELTNVDSMVINSFFHGWGLGKSDTELKQSFSEYYRESLLSTCPHTLQPLPHSDLQAINLPSGLVHSPLNDSVTNLNAVKYCQLFHSSKFRVQTKLQRQQGVAKVLMQIPSYDVGYWLSRTRAFYKPQVQPEPELIISKQKTFSDLKKGDKVLVAFGPQRKILTVAKSTKTILTLDNKIKISVKTGRSIGFRKNLFSPSIVKIIESQSEPDLIIPIELPVIDEPLGQAQCWICPHCYDDSHHQSDENGCEWQYKQDAIDAKRYRWLKQQDFALFDVYGVFGHVDLLLQSDDIDLAIDKAMAVLSS